MLASVQSYRPAPFRAVPWPSVAFRASKNIGPKGWRSASANSGSAGILPAFSLLKHAAKMAALPGSVKARKISDAHHGMDSAGMELSGGRATHYSVGHPSEARKSRAEVDEEFLVEFLFQLAESDGCLVALAVFKTVVGSFHGSR